MIDPDIRNAVFQLHQQGMSQREISRRLHVSRNAARTIIRQEGKFARKERNDKIQIDSELLARLYRECDGWIQGVYENRNHATNQRTDTATPSTKNNACERWEAKLPLIWTSRCRPLAFSVIGSPANCSPSVAS
jgi:transcriptional regulator with XRE-family HTH domain